MAPPPETDAVRRASRDTAGTFEAYEALPPTPTPLLPVEVSATGLEVEEEEVAASEAADVVTDDW